MNDNIVDVIKKIQVGDASAFHTLYESTYPSAFRMAMRLCKDEQDAKDICQEAYLQIYSSIYELREPKYFYVWLSRIVTSKATRLFRSKKHVCMDKKSMENLRHEEKRKVYLPQLHVDEDTEMMLMHAFVEELKPKLRMVIEDFYFKQYSVEEIAQRYGISQGTVKSRLHNARKQLKTRIEQFEQMEQRKIHFHEKAAAVLLASYAGIKKKWIQFGTSSTATTTMITASVLTIGALAVSGGTQIVKERQEIPQTERIEVQQVYTQTGPSFQAVYQNKPYTNEKQAYYEIKRWGQTPELAKTKSEQEVKEIQPLYEALKNTDSPFKAMLMEEGWDSVFKN